MIQDKNNIEEKVVDYWTKRVADFSDVRENELDSELSREWVDKYMSGLGGNNICRESR